MEALSGGGGGRGGQKGADYTMQLQKDTKTPKKYAKILTVKRQE